MDTQVEAVLRRDIGLARVLDEARGTEFALRHTQADTAVTLAWAYADCNRVTVAYTIAVDTVATLNRPPMSPISLLTRDDSPVELPPLYGYGNPDGTLSANCYTFSNTLSSDVDALDLRLTLTVSGYAYAFDFALPVDSAYRVFDRPQTATDRGIDLTLERMTVTPSQVVARIRFVAPDPARHWTSIPYLIVDGVSVNSGGVLPHPSADSRSTREDIFFNTAVAGVNDPWQLEVRELIGFGPDGGNDQQHLTGVWRFDFTIPPR